MLNPDGIRLQDLRFTFTLEETNLILEALGQMPFVKVHQLITKLQHQAESQLQSPSPNDSEQS